MADGGAKYVTVEKQGGGLAVVTMRRRERPALHARRHCRRKQRAAASYHSPAASLSTA